MSMPSKEAALRRLFWKLFFRSRALSRRPGQEGKIEPHRMTAVLALYVFFGCFVSVQAFHSDTLAFSLALHGTTLFLIVFQMVASVGTVLFNKEEAEILLHRPVTAGELLRAKVFVLCAVSLMLAVALNLPGMITGLWLSDAHWWFPLVHLVSLVLVTLFSASTLIVVYQASLRCFGRERLDNLMTTVQTILTVALIGCSQAFRLFHTAGFQTAAHSRWLLAVPPAWFASFDTLLASRHPPLWLFAPAAAGVLATGVMSWLGLHQLAATYGAGLMLMNEAGSGGRRTQKRRTWLRRLLQTPPLAWWVSDPVERESFLLTAAYLTRDRELKLRIYPSLAQVVAMPIFVLFIGGSGDNGGWDIAFAGIYLGWLPLMALQSLEFSEQWRAAELFSLTPYGRWPALFHGARKAVLALLTAPLAIGLTVAVLLFKRADSELLLLLPSLIATPVWSLAPGLAEAWIPLGQPYDAKSQSQRGCLTLILVMAVSAGISAAALYAESRGCLGWFLLAETLAAIALYTTLRAIITRRGK